MTESKRLAIKVILVLIASLTLGLLFAIVPCYLFPLFGADARVWCGYKSLGQYFEETFLIGAVLGLILAAIGLFHRAPPPER